jgi:hypothetical protein
LQIDLTQQEQDLNEKLQCIFANVGAQVGDILRCMVSQEISQNLNRIQQLNAILNGNDCYAGNITQPTI